MTATPVTDSGGATARIGALDGLRALVLLVLFFHFSINVTRGGDWKLAAPVLTAGMLGVVGLDVFFVLSGFLITGILLDSKGAPDYFRNFYVRRAVRILPVYYGFLALYLLVVPQVVPWDASAIRLSLAEQLPYWLYTVNVPYALDGHLAAYTGHYWSLAIEEQFYLVWPLVVCLASPRRLRHFCLGILIISPLVRLVCSYAAAEHALFPYAFTPCRLDGLALGALLALARRQPGGFDRLLPLLKRAALLAGVGLLALVAVLLGKLAVGGYKPGWELAAFLTASAWVAAGFVATVLSGRGGVLRRVAEAGPARRIGVYSYAMYIIHDPLAYLVERGFGLERPGPQATFLGLLGYFLLMSTFTVALAALSWHWFEKPLLRLRPPMAKPAAAG